MKSIIFTIALIIASSTCHAGTWAIAANQNGGYISLTDDPCVEGKLGKLMYTTLKTGKSIYGCWTYFTNDDVVHVSYFDGTTYTYPISAFKFTQYGEIHKTKEF